MTDPEERITDAELEVMDALWSAPGPMTLVLSASSVIPAPHAEPWDQI